MGPFTVELLPLFPFFPAPPPPPPALTTPDPVISILGASPDGLLASIAVPPLVPGL